MPKDYPRTRRVAEQIQRELAEIIRQEIKDPRIGMITLTDVEVSPDFSHAKIFFTHLGESRQTAESLSGLQHAAGFLRSHLAHRLKLYAVPELHFIYDTSVERGVRLSSLIDQAISEDKRHTS
ncbi:MAG: 30S ribosome-binding factor RbfA [Burkholderiales bacterium]